MPWWRNSPVLTLRDNNLTSDRDAEVLVSDVLLDRLKHLPNAWSSGHSITRFRNWNNVALISYIGYSMNAINRTIHGRAWINVDSLCSLMGNLYSLHSLWTPTQWKFSVDWSCIWRSEGLLANWIAVNCSANMRYSILQFFFNRSYTIITS